MLTAIQKTGIDFLLEQLRKLNSGNEPDPLPANADMGLSDCYKELLKFRDKEKQLPITEFINSLDLALVVEDKSGNIILSNEKYQQLLELKNNHTEIQHHKEIKPIRPKQITGRRAPADPNEKQTDQALLPEGSESIMVIGSRRYIRSRKVLKKIGYITSYSEITGFKKVEDELKSSKSNLRAAIDAANQAILLLDRQGRIVVANKSVSFYALLMGIKTRLTKGTNVFETLTEPYKTYIGAPFKRALKGEVLEFEREIPTAVGRLFFFATYAPVKANEKQVTGVVISFFDVTEKRKIQERSVELIRKRARMKEERVRLAALIQGQETERKRLARDIHDGLGQMLTAIRLQIEMADPVSLGMEEEESLKNIKNNIRNTIAEARRIAHDLMPSVLEDFGLSAALKLLINQYKKSSGIEIQFVESKKASAKTEQGHQLKIALYRIVQEALSNIVKHSGATQCMVALNHHIQNISLNIRDNGNNFTYPLKNGQGLGILSMKERAELLNGKFFIEAGEHNSCHIQVVIPIKPRYGKN